MLSLTSTGQKWPLNKDCGLRCRKLASNNACPTVQSNSADLAALAGALLAVERCSSSADRKTVGMGESYATRDLKMHDDSAHGGNSAAGDLLCIAARW